MNFYVVHRKESGDDEEEVDTYNPPVPPITPANQSNSIDDKSSKQVHQHHSSQVVHLYHPLPSLYHQFLPNESALEGEHIIVVVIVFPKFLKRKLNQKKETH